VALALASLALCCRARDAKAPLLERAQAYWELKQSKRWEEVYDAYLDPELKNGLPREGFLKKRLLAFDILSFAITEAREEGDEGTVVVTNEVDLPVRGAGGSVRIVKKTVTTTDSWARRDGMWYVRLSE
jgi:hypothetical protein